MGGSLGLASGQLVTPDYAAVDNGEETSRSLLGSTALHTVLQSNNGNTRDTAVYWGARGSPNLHCTGEGDLISSSPIDSMNCPKQLCNYM